jgi:hypothetical protein
MAYFDLENAHQVRQVVKPDTAWTETNGVTNER